MAHKSHLDGVPEMVRITYTLLAGPRRGEEKTITRQVRAVKAGGRRIDFEDGSKIAGGSYKTSKGVRIGRDVEVEPVPGLEG